MIEFAHPEAWLLALAPLWWLWRRRGSERRAVEVARLLLVLLLVGALTGPRLRAHRAGRDLVLAVDRSRSTLEFDPVQRLREFAREAARTRRPGDGIGVVQFAGRAQLVRPPREQPWEGELPAVPEPDHTDIAAGLRTALASIPAGRPGSILLLSDGEDHGDELETATLEAARRGVRVDVVPLRRGAVLDLAVQAIEPPREVETRRHFAVPIWIEADVPAEATLRVWRDATLIAQGRRRFEAGRSRIVVRDRIEQPGVHHYRAELVGANDARPGDDVARAVVRVLGTPRVLCVTPGGREDRLTTALRAAGLEVLVSAPATAPLDLDSLDAVRAVVLENVLAGELPAGALGTLAHWVRDLGGGLVMTGGAASFGRGGYRASPIEPVLPVSLEVRKEQRRFQVALAIALDRSGSMGMTVAGGLTKMELANRGAAEAVRLLGPGDLVAVLAVDSSAHVVLPLSPVEQHGGLIARIMGIESEGGGIYTATAIRAAAEQLARAPDRTRHIVLFADAADAEEPDALVEEVAPKLQRAGVGISVIALGAPSDPDAAFLEALARAGGGRIHFVQDPSDLPRVFAEETITVLQAALVREPTDVEARPPLRTLGDLPLAFPRIGGYSIAYLRPEAQLAAVSLDENHAPILSFRSVGLGRTVALLAEVDGELSGPLGDWPGLSDLLEAMVRWSAGGELPDPLFASLERRGRTGRLVIEAERGAESLLSRVRGRVFDPAGRAVPLVLERVAPDRLEARFALERLGAYRAAVQLDEGVGVALAPVALPRSPEDEPPADPEAGLRRLERVAAATGGRVDPPADELFVGPRVGRGWR
ncbi:MAG: VWA domain-containing protein, partial [Planctomycetota bacterium]